MALLADPTTALIFLGTFLTGLWYLRWRKQNLGTNLPPGPPVWPLVGSIPYIFGSDIRHNLQKLRSRYGDIITVRIGEKLMIFLSSYEAVKDAFVKQGGAFAGRPQDDFIVKDIAQGKGIVMIEGEFWQEQRKICHNVLRKLGLGQGIMEMKILEEIDAFKAVLLDNVDKPFDAGFLIQRAVANVIYSVVFGHRRDYNDQNFHKYLRKMDENFKAVVSAGPVTVFPWLKYFPGDPFKCKAVLETAEFIRTVMTNIYRQHKYNQSDTPNNFIDEYLGVMKQLGQEEEEFQTVSIAGDLFFAGTETSTTTLKWCLLYMLHYPHMMEKMCSDIDDVISHDRAPSMKDKTRLPYVEAFLNEVNRHASVVPLGVPHATMKDVNFCGFTIPKGATILSVICSIHHDSRKFPEPEKFKPERFLNSDGTAVVNTEYLIPFSIGKRVCLGESLARMELFLFLTSMLQMFTFHPVEGQQLPPLKGSVSVTHAPEDFEIVVKHR